MYNRRKTKVIKAGGVAIGGDAPITIQSMTTTKTADTAATLMQVNSLISAGCEIVRLAVNDDAALMGFAEVKKKINAIPLVADIHFNHELAIKAINAGADKIRINPGNIGSKENIAAVVAAAKKHRVPIRVGVNSGSLERDLLDAYGGTTAEGLAKSAMRNIKLLEDLDFDDIVVSLKASNIPMTLQAHEILAPQMNYPLHIGITEAGTMYSGTIKSVAGIAAMLTRGFGDTIRVSLAADPAAEVAAAKELLKALRLRRFGPDIIACPTCGRTQINIIALANEVESKIGHITAPITIAIMGCAVNGPGEARECDIGIAAGSGGGVLFRKGHVVQKLAEREIVPVLLHEIERLENEYRQDTNDR